ncbi:MAG: U32 family peptidase [Desulfovibrionaceae bacterium]
MIQKPVEIIAPAVNMETFLVALSAGANAIFLGLQHSSARMKTQNFSSTDLAQAIDLAHTHNTKVYLAINSLVKANDIQSVANLISRTIKNTPPDAFIIQDLGIIPIARDAGFIGEFHLSTLANIGHINTIQQTATLDIHRVILPQESYLEELQSLNTLCPDSIDLELFVHRAPCNIVSGKWYWPSCLRGKSNVKEQYIQPCKRMYSHGKKSAQAFSSFDFSLETIVNDILPLKKISSWKIEGRKNNAHYIYHATKAYVLLRDYPEDPKAKKEAHRLLELAINLTTTNALIKTTKNNTPIDNKSQTNIALLIGKVFPKNGTFLLETTKELFPLDLLHVGYKDEAWHTTIPIRKNIKVGATLSIRFTSKKLPSKPVNAFLIERKSLALRKEVALWQGKLDHIPRIIPSSIHYSPPLPKPKHYSSLPTMSLQSVLPIGKANKASGLSLWVSQRTVKEISRTIVPKIHWWLPPVIWHDEENSFKRLLATLIKNGATHFVCNDIFQYSMLPQHASYIAGPFCNIANASTLECIQNLGYEGAIVSPELSKEELLSLVQQSPLPLGFVTKGFFPVGITRLSPQGIFSKNTFVSEKGESFWIKRHGSTVWYYPALEIDLSGTEKELTKAGFSFYVHTVEHAPKNSTITKRQRTLN